MSRFFRFEDGRGDIKKKEAMKMKAIKIWLSCFMVIGLVSMLLIASPAFAMGKLPGKGKIARAEIPTINVGIATDTGEILTEDKAASSQTAAVPGFYMAVKEINDSGVFDVTPFLRNTGGKTPSEVETLTEELLNQGILYLHGGQISSNTLLSAPMAVDNGVVYAASNSASDTFSGCTGTLIFEELNEPSDTPIDPTASKTYCWLHHGYFYRTHGLGSKWGMAGACYATKADGYSTLTKAKALIRAGNAPGDEDSFDLTVRNGFKNGYVAAGKTFLGTVIYPKSPAATPEDFKDLIDDLLEGDTEIIVGLWRRSDLLNFLQGWNLFYNDSATPAQKAQMDDMRFIHMGSVRGKYEDMISMRERAVGIQPHFDPASTGYKKWETIAQAYNYSNFPYEIPDVDVTPAKNAEAFKMFETVDGVLQPKFRHSMAAYDAVMIYFLALKKSEIDLKALDIEEEYRDNVFVTNSIHEVANPNPQRKKIFYPGEFAAACKALEHGTDINYEGASSSVNLDKSGNVTGAFPYLVWSVDTDGAADDLSVFKYPECPTTL